ncbi:MAG: hypothetical protein KAH99_03820 [Verrucomicrobia bacterium]|nr:hypothetical protein [Verrucomicrobiota bacterium]
MSQQKRKKIIRLLGVGFDTEDGHVRITQGENYDVLMGSEQSHEYIQKLIQKIEEGLKSKGLDLDDLTPDEFHKFVGSIE